MATIELVDVCKTLKEGGPAGRGSTFSIQKLNLTSSRRPDDGRAGAERLR